MAIDYDAAAALSERLITENGSAIEVERTGSDSTWTKKYDAATQRVYWEDGDSNIVYTAPGDTVTTYAGYGVFSRWPERQIDGTLIKMTDTRVLIVLTPTSVDLVPGDVLITAASREFQIVDPVRLIKPNETKLLLQEVNARG